MVDLLDDVLPDECARIIWAQLRPQDLRAVMRVSPTWAKSAAPFLYRNVDLRDATALAALLRTVQRRPDVAALVRHLRMHQHVFSGPNRPQSLAGPAVDLLQSLPALQGLRLEGRWSGLDALISNGRLRVPLTDLRKVSLGIGRQPMAHLLPFWNLPKIESIRACMASPYDAIQEQQQEEEEEDQEEEAEPPITWPTAPTLLELDLDYTSLEEKSVTPLLRNSPALKSFRYDRWCNVGGVLSLQDCEELGRGLRHLRPTLEHLDLRVQLFSEYAEEVDELDIDPVQGHLPSLRDFNQLRTLRIPIATLLGWTPNEVPRIETLLPPSLQRLSLAEDLRTQCTYQWTEELLLVELERFFASLSRSQHKLEVVEIYPDRTWGGWQNETMNRVYGMAATAAVQCIIVD